MTLTRDRAAIQGHACGFQRHRVNNCAVHCRSWVIAPKTINLCVATEYRMIIIMQNVEHDARMIAKRH